MAIGDMFAVTHKFTAFGVKMNSAFHCKRLNAGEAAQEINDSYAFSILPFYRLFQTTDFVNDELVCFNLGDPLDFHTQSLLGALGLRAGDSEPSFVAAAVKFPTLNREIHSGQKRFSGLIEADLTDGLIAPATLTIIDNLSDALIANWLASSDSHAVASYAIIKRVCETTDPVTGKCLKYRLPKTDPELKFYEPTAQIANNQASSQTSRKTF